VAVGLRESLGGWPRWVQALALVGGVFGIPAGLLTVAWYIEEHPHSLWTWYLPWYLDRLREHWPLALGLLVGLVACAVAVHLVRKFRDRSPRMPDMPLEWDQTSRASRPLPASMEELPPDHGGRLHLVITDLPTLALRLLRVVMVEYICTGNRKIRIEGGGSPFRQALLDAAGSTAVAEAFSDLQSEGFFSMILVDRAEDSLSIDFVLGELVPTVDEAISINLITETELSRR